MLLKIKVPEKITRGGKMCTCVVLDQSIVKGQHKKFDGEWNPVRVARWLMRTQGYTEKQASDWVFNTVWDNDGLENNKERREFCVKRLKKLKGVKVI